MRNLGNRLTLHSPARGFSMELGAAVTIILATRLSKLSQYHAVPTNTFRTSCLHHSVHHWCYRRSWSLLRYLAINQLAYGYLDLHGLDHHSPRRWYHLWMHLRYHYQRSSLGLPGLALLFLVFTWVERAESSYHLYLKLLLF